MVRARFAIALLMACGCVLAATSTLAATNNKAVPKPAKKTEVLGFYTVRDGAYLKGGLALRLAVNGKLAPPLLF